MKNKHTKLSRWIAVMIGSAFLLLSVVTVWFYKIEKQSIRNRAVAQLTTIGKLKSAEIAQWRAARLADAAVMQEGSFLVEGVMQFLASPLEENATPIRNQFNGFRKYYHYDDVLLVDAEGTCVFSLSGKTFFPLQHVQEMAEARLSRKPVLTEIHASETEEALHAGAELHASAAQNEPHLGVVVPFFMGTEPSLAFSIVLVCNVSEFLSPILRSWPVPSKTSEIMLSRIDGEDILLLNNLIDAPDAALKLRIPLTRKAAPAVVAATGFEGVVQGIDYRGVEVLSYVCRISDSPWFMVAKQDAVEIFADWHLHSLIIFGLYLLVGLVLLAAGVASWQQSRNAHYRVLYDYESKLRVSLEKQSITLKAVGDAVIATDKQGYVDFLNPVAERFTGWSNEEAQGQLLETVFHIVNEQTRAIVENPVKRVLREGNIVGLGNHTVLISRHGIERPIADSAAPIRDEKDCIIGVVLVFRDQTTEHNYKMLFHQMLDGFAVHQIICDESGRPVNYRFLDVNPAFERMTGLKACDIVGKNVLDVLPGTEQSWMDRYGQVALTGEPTSFESYSKEFDKYFFVTAFRPLPNQFATIFIDVTVHRQMEQALLESEKRFRSLTDDVLDNAEVGTFILDSEFKIAWVNKAMARYFGFERDSVLGRSKREVVRETIAKIFENPDTFVSKLFATYDKNTYSEKFICHVMPCEGREERWLQHSSQPIVSGLFAGGRVEHYYDITAIKSADEKLKKQNEALALAVSENGMLAAAVEQSGDLVIITDTAGAMQYVNSAFEKVTGYSRDEIRGKNPRILKSGKHDDAFYQEMWNTLKAGKPFYSRMVNQRKDGTLFTEDATISPVLDPMGQVVNYVGVKRDITERLQMEEHLAQTLKMETVGRLAGGVAHDFNNMLGVILGNAEQLAEKLPELDPLREETQCIITAAKRSSEMTRQLLAFAKKQIIKPKILDLNESVEGCLRMLRRLIAENISLVWNPQSSESRVKMDPVQIDQILTNLCVNARDAIGDGGTITIKTATITCRQEDCADHPGSRPGEYVMLSVADTGSGMSSETLSHLFEPFYTTKGVGEGTGLGLATVHGITSQNGGFITVKSQLGSGTKFTVFLPAQTAPIQEMQADVKAVIPEGHGEVVLIAEDEPTLLKLSTTILTRLGYHVISASGPEEALELAQAQTGGLDLLLSDVVMSGMNGKDLAQKVLLIHPTAKVLFMSGYTSDVMASHGILEEGVNFIQKPFTRNDIAVQIHKCLQGG